MIFQGLTIQVDENGNLIIARILGGSTAASQGLLRPGEVILEVNGKLVLNPDELQIAIADAKENLTLKLAPGIAGDGSKPIKSTVILHTIYTSFTLYIILCPILASCKICLLIDKFSLLGFRFIYRRKESDSKVLYI